MTWACKVGGSYLGLVDYPAHQGANGHACSLKCSAHQSLHGRAQAWMMIYHKLAITSRDCVCVCVCVCSTFCDIESFKRFQLGNKVHIWSY